MKAYVRLAVILSVTLVLAGGIYWGAESGWGRLRPIEVVMEPHSDQPQLFARIQASLQSDLKSYQGQWLWQASLPQILKQVQSDKRVRSARVVRVFPNRVKIEVEPQEPVLAYVDEVGTLFPIATDASLLPALPLNEVRDLPLLRGKVFKNNLALREQAIELMQALPRSGPLAMERVAEVSYSKKSGFSLMLTQGGTEVRLGDADISLKAERIARVLNYLQGQQLRGRVIDARFAKKVVVRLRNDP